MIQNLNQLGIVIVTWNAGEVVIPCLQSIQKSDTDYLHNVVIVDNHSTDGGEEKIKTLFPEVNLIRNKENYGFSKAVNIGLKFFERKYYLLLNPDTEVMPDTIPKLITFMESNETVGIAGPLIYSSEKIPELSFGAFPNPWNEFGQRKRFYRLQRKEPDAIQWIKQKMNKSLEVDWVSGACFLIRKEVIQQVGYLDENFFAYFEDIDYCYRAYKSGWRICYYPLTRIQHIRGYSKAKNENKMKLEYRKSQSYYYKKNCAFLSQMILSLIRVIKQD